MLRPFDVAGRQRHQENNSENDEPALTKEHLATRASGKGIALLKDKNVNQAHRTPLSEKGKSKDILKTPLKRPLPRKMLVDAPASKRPHSGGVEVEFGFGHEQENDYVPDGVDALDFGMFGKSVSMDAYDSAKTGQLALPMRQQQSFAYPERQNTSKRKSKGALQPRQINVPTPESAVHRHITDDNKENIPAFPDTIEHAPKPETPLDDVPATPIDLSSFSSSFYQYGDCAIIGDEEFPWPDLFEDDDKDVLDPLEIAAKLNDSEIAELLVSLLSDEPVGTDALFAVDDDDEVEFDTMPFADFALPELPDLIAT